MSHVTNFWSGVLTAIESGQRVFVVIVAANTKHSPGTAGARMYVPAVGEPVGTIGGGGMEMEIIRRAKRSLDGGFEPTVRRLVHRKNPESGEPSGLICAGEQTHVEFVVGPEHAHIIADILDLVANDKPGVFTVRGSGLELEYRSPVKGEPPITLGSTDDVYFEEQLLATQRVAIMGGGHCGLALSRLLRQLGYVVTVFDDRPDCRTFLDNIYANTLELVDSYENAAAKIRYPHLTDVVVMTTGMLTDIEALQGLADSNAEFQYVGVMGSKTKIRNIVKALSENGVEKAWLDALVAPIGLPMKSDTPDEIAVSIAAQLLSER